MQEKLEKEYFFKFWFCTGSPLPPPPPPPRISPDSSSGSGSVIGANHNKYSSRKTKSNSKYHHTSNNNVTFKAHINNGGSVTSSSLILHPGTSRTRQKKIKKRKKGMYHNISNFKTIQFTYFNRQAAVGHWVSLYVCSVVGWLIAYQLGILSLSCSQYSQTIC